MNRLESLQLYPVQYRKIFYLGAPTVFIFFAIAILVSCFGLSFQEAQDYWYIPGLIGGAFSWYAFHNVVAPNADQDTAESKTDIEADPRILKEELEKANRSIPQIIKYLMGILSPTPPSFFPRNRATGRFTCNELFFSDRSLLSPGFACLFTNSWGP